MTQVHQGEAIALTAQFTTYPGGPADDLQSTPTITITPLAGGAAVVGPTSSGVTHPATGLYAYTWSVPAGTATGDYAVVWDGTDAQSDAVQASEVVTVVTALATTYADLATLKLALGGITATDKDALLNQALVAASRQIDAFTGRRFYADATATARVYRASKRVLYDGNGQVLFVDDISTDSGLVVETGVAGATPNWTATTDYETDPDNALADGRPITGLRLLTLTPWALDYRGRVRVTAKWGWPAVPDVVVEACLIQAARLFKRKDSPEGVAGVAGFGDAGVVRYSRVDPDVQALLAHLCLPSFA